MGSWFGLLQTWCDGMIRRQVRDTGDPQLDGALLCPACGTIHGRCVDAAWPMFYLADVTGEQRYLDAAGALLDWMPNVDCPNGAFSNQPGGRGWQGITVFAAMGVAEILHRHGHLLGGQRLAWWRKRLGRAADYIATTFAPEFANINYPVVAVYTLALISEVLARADLRTKADELLAAIWPEFFVEGLLVGEGRPLIGATPRGARAIDIGYNVAESLPALVLYGRLLEDDALLDALAEPLAAHMEWMLPDGAWDNSVGTRNYKWTWWGSRTSDGCQPAYALLADRDPRFAEVARRSTDLMARCTHDGLLAGGPDLSAAGLATCIHHTFTHAKAITAVLERMGAACEVPTGPALPCDVRCGARHWACLDTWQIGAGDWRATVCSADATYARPSGRAGGGALSLLYHMRFGPVLSASMVRYERFESHNMQHCADSTDLPLTPRVQFDLDGESYTNLTDTTQTVSVRADGDATIVHVDARLLDTQRRQPPACPVRVRLTYRIAPQAVELLAELPADAPAGVVLHVPVRCRADWPRRWVDDRTVCIVGPGGALMATASVPFVDQPTDVGFNLVPGLQALGLAVPVAPGGRATVSLRTSE